MDLRLGTSIHEAIFVLGTPDSVYLAGMDAEARITSPGDALILRWERTCDLAGQRPCSISAVLAPGEALVSRIRAWFPPSDRPALQDLGDIVEGKAESVMRRLGPGAIEADIGQCHVLNGEVITIIYPRVGLDVYLEMNGSGVELLEFSLQRLSEGTPPSCKD